MLREVVEFKRSRVALIAALDASAFQLVSLDEFQVLCVASPHLCARAFSTLVATFLAVVVELLDRLRIAALGAISPRSTIGHVGPPAQVFAIPEVFVYLSGQV
jgi:hypothetical protein